MRYFLAILVILFSLNCEDSSPTRSIPDEKKLPMLHTEGRWFADESGEKVILRGVNIASMEWDAAGNNMLTSVEVAVNDWGSNFLRIPLAQDRWFGYAPEQDHGAEPYRDLLDAVIDKATELDAYIWLDLHWNNAGVWGQYIGQHKMPDENSITFWQDVAARYKNHPTVMFGLYNEPHNISWDIWLNGGEVSETVDGENITYTAVGHQALVDSIRATGANNIIIAGGIDWGYDLSGILNGYALQGENIAYDTHPYPWKNEDWDRYWGDVGEQYPIVVGEWGGTVEEGHQPYGIKIADYMRSHKFAWTAWCFHPSAGPQLLEDWNYNPTWFGDLVMRELSNPVEVQ